ncbi:hypothetical protein RSOLAG22IIIB_01820 [Rhizoctonia solani]|uniref:Uncharacterized protein n=1 Tax=Rhizoctonia solani TaxID=456999 RepID=A0A0K6G979_9AGAM|nr:hypothetical protein RSOLAG22IIIB_01820 [Rhizoctonia solani]
MKFTRVVSFLVTVVSTSVLVVATPVETLSGSDISGLCRGCNPGRQVLSLVKKLQADTRATLALLENCRTTGCNTTDLFVELAAKVDQCNNAAVTLEVDDTNLDSKTKVQVSEIVTRIILDVSTGCSKFQDVNIEDFVYVSLCSKIDVALKELCITLDLLIKGCLGLISSICLPKSALLLAANFKACLSIFTNLSLGLA